MSFFMPDHSTINYMTAYMAWADDLMLTSTEQLLDADLIAPRDALFTNITGTFLITHWLFRKFPCPFKGS